MTTLPEPSQRHTIGPAVYRQRYDGSDWWYDRHTVEHIGPKQVLVRGLLEEHCIALSRESLERRGTACSFRHGAVFVLELPEEYRRRTIGYLMAVEPRQVLGLAEGFTPEELRQAYRRKALETHPDRGGDADAFRAVQAAYEQLQGRGGAEALVAFAAKIVREQKEGE